jgi:hypothetical protein
MEANIANALRDDSLGKPKIHEVDGAEDVPEF